MANRSAIDLLCERAGGLFVYAVATPGFLDHAFTPPSKQLDIITKSPGSTAHEGSVEVRASATLDSLYVSCVQGAFDRMNADDDAKVRFVIGTVVLAMNPLPPSAIATLVELEKQEVMDLLRLIQSLLKLSEDPDSPALPFHKSFPDFITDSLRCPNKRFHISPRAGHLRLALNCLKLMNGSLEQNPLSLPDYALNSEIEDLQTRKEDRIGVALEYACKSWHSHLTEARGDVTAVISTLRSFLREGFLAWLEVLSVIGAARDAIIALENLVVWLQEVRFGLLSCISRYSHTPSQVARDHQLLDTARDYLHFATTFFEVIDISATHIYHSALELSPLSSIIRGFYYYQRPHPSPRVVLGIPDSWDPSTAVSTTHSCYLSSVWSPCGQFVATAAVAAVQIRDAHALEVLSTSQPTKVGTRFRQGLTYSPDGCSLAGCSDTAIVIWDTQTGGMVKAIECEVPVDGLELVWSSDGTTIGIVSPQGWETSTMRTYDVASGTNLSPGTLQSRGGPYLWAHGTSFRIATTTELGDGYRINIFQVGSTLTKIESFPLRLRSNPGLSSCPGPFSPTTYRISLSVTDPLPAPVDNQDAELFILDVRSSEILLQERVTGCYWNLSFSPDGSFFMAFAKDRLLIWKHTSGCYARWRDFRQTSAFLQFSPTSSSILGHAGPLLHVVHLDRSLPTLANEPVTRTHNVPRDTYSPHGTYIATTHRGEKTITITDLRPKNPSSSHFVDVDFEISEIVLTGNVLLAKGSEAVVAWLLTEEGVVSGILGNRRAGPSESLWAMSSRDTTTEPRDKGSSFWTRLLPRDRGKRNGDDRLEFSTEDGIAAVRNPNGFDIRIYNVETGEILEHGKAPLNPGRTWYRFHNPHRDDCDLYHRDLKNYKPLKCDWPISHATLREGWVKDPEGKHRLWLHARWRSIGNDVDWLDRVTTMRLKNSSELVVVRF